MFDYLATKSIYTSFEFKISLLSFCISFISCYHGNNVSTVLSSSKYYICYCTVCKDITYRHRKHTFMAYGRSNLILHSVNTLSFILSGSNIWEIIREQ